MRKLLVLGLISGLPLAAALADPPAAPVAASTATAAPDAATTAHIGTVNVTGIKHLVETLEEIKVA